MISFFLKTTKGISLYRVALKTVQHEYYVKSFSFKDIKRWNQN